MKVVYIFDGKVIGQREGRFISPTPLPGDHVSLADGEAEESFIVDYRKWVFASSDGFSYPIVIEIYLMK
jgi:hypothetical protein